MSVLAHTQLVCVLVAEQPMRRPCVRRSVGHGNLKKARIPARNRRHGRFDVRSTGVEKESMCSKGQGRVGLLLPLMRSRARTKEKFTRVPEKCKEYIWRASLSRALYAFERNICILHPLNYERIGINETNINIEICTGQKRQRFLKLE